MVDRQRYVVMRMHQSCTPSRIRPFFSVCNSLNYQPQSRLFTDGLAETAHRSTAIAMDLAGSAGAQARVIVGQTLTQVKQPTQHSVLRDTARQKG